MQIVFSDNMAKDIVDIYAIGEICEESLDRTRKNYQQEISSIRSIHGLKDPQNTILRYGALEMRKNLNKERVGEKRFDWDSLTYKDDNGDLIDLVCDRVEALDEITKQEISTKIVCKILENIMKYYEKEFEEKVEDTKSYYQQYGVNDYYMEA
jgi:hypothetical protein